MPSYQAPVLLWKDHEDYHTGVPVEVDLFDPTEIRAAFAESGRRVLDRLKDYLAWWYREHPEWEPPNFHDPELISVSVGTHPEYDEDGGPYLCDEVVELKVPCVHGRRENGLVVCSMPTLGLFFQLNDGARVAEIAAAKVQEAVARLSPLRLARLLPPEDLRLDTVRITVRRPRESTQRFVPEVKTLEQVADAIGKPAFRKRFTAAWEREAELGDLSTRLGEEKVNVVLVGKHGVGKSTLLFNAIRGLERRGVTGDDDDDDENEVDFRFRYWLTGGSRLVAGMQYLGEWQERCETVIDELSGINGVLCVDSLSELLLQGGAGPDDSIAAFLMTYLENGELRLVAEATPEELDACRRLLPGFVELFQVMRVGELQGARALNAISELAKTRMRNIRVTLGEQVIETVCRLYHRFMPYRVLPGPATIFLANLLDDTHHSRREQLTVDDVVGRFVAETGLPEHLLRDDQPMDVEDVDRELAVSVIGQEEPCRVIAEIIATFKAGMNDPARPLGTLLFCGPTGVGKTQLARTTADYLFGHGEQTERLVRLDMSEYSSPYAARRLITEDDGSPSRFISQVRQQPFVVVLLDEIEKADASVFDTLLGVLDEGRLTDRFGRTTTFASAIIIMTSNLGTSSRQPVGFGRESDTVAETTPRSFFRPEFYNRIDAVVTFQALSPETCRAITRKELGEIGEREGLTRAGLKLDFSDELVEYLAEEGFDRRYGARPLQRTLETRVVTVLSRYLIEHPGLGDSTIGLDIDDDGNVILT